MFAEGEILPTMKVKVFPVKESWSKRVNFDYRNAAILLFLLDRLAITFPKVVKDWLMFFSYLKWSSFISSLLFTFSDPAKSHKLSLAFYIFLLFTLNIPLPSAWVDSIKIWKIVCDLELFVFIEVCLMNLFFYPLFMSSRQSK